MGSLAAMVFGSGTIAMIGQASFGLTAIAHLAEFFMKRSVMERSEGSMGHHFTQTMIYGFFHWKPLEDQLK